MTIAVAHATGIRLAAAAIVASLCLAPAHPSEPAIAQQPAFNSDGSPRVLPPGPPALPGLTAIFDYYDFGPQAMSLGLVGQAWWQWAECACFEPGDEMELRVVVFRGISPAAVAQHYPTVKNRSDYRYLAYVDAIAYLDAQILDLAGDTDFDALRAELVATRARIIAVLG